MSANKRVGRKNAVKYQYVLPTRTVVVLRYYEDIHELRYDPENPRLATKLERSGERKTQAALHDLLENEVKADQLVESLRVSGGINNPILITQDKRTKEGSRRLCAHRILDTEGINDNKFRYVPVEELPKNVTLSEISMLLLIHHVRQEKSWATIDRVRHIRKMLAEGEYTTDQICTVLNRKETWLNTMFAASTMYDQYFDFSSKRKSKAKKKVREDLLWTYFQKICNKPKFITDVLSNESELSNVFEWLQDGKFNECLNVEKLPQIMSCPAAREILDSEGGTYDDAKSKLGKWQNDRRESDFWPYVKRIKNGVKKMSKRDKCRLTTPEGLPDRQLLVVLRNEIDSVLAETELSVSKKAS